MSNALAEQQGIYFPFPKHTGSKSDDENIAIVGLGYVGLPLSIALAETHETVVGYDIDQRRVEALDKAIDWTGEVDTLSLVSSTLSISNHVASLATANFYIIAVPTPVDARRRPDLSNLRRACRTVGRYLKPDDVVVFESTVYPGATEEVCAPELSKASNLQCGVDFNIAYSPERISPGDAKHGLKQIKKIVSADNADTLDRVARLYERVVPAGIHRAPTIQVAEAAKVFENTQRDVNIALMNEFSLLCDRMGIRTQNVIDATQTKWNALPFTPGLVGGHCIGVDPYYLAYKAEEYGMETEILTASRRLNERMGPLIAQRAIKFLSLKGTPPASARIGIVGLSFKEDVPDLRNSKVFSIIDELKSYAASPLVYDPVVTATAAFAHGVQTVELTEFDDLDVLILAVPHRDAMKSLRPTLNERLSEGALVMDIKSVLSAETLSETATLWSL